MKLGIHMMAAVVLAAWLMMGAARQGPDPQQTAHPPATQASPGSQPNSTPGTQANPNPATQASPAPEMQTQPSGEPKPGQGATPDQHPSPVPEVNPTTPQANPPNEGTAKGVTSEAKHPEAKKKTAAHKGGAPGKPRRRVVKDGGADESEVQISEGMTGDLAQNKRASTNTLLTSTEENLKRISNRRLTADQQGTVDQIRLFMQQSRDAIQKSDVDRAHTLALKAHLLSNSLVKP
jgi:hypothetical protein